MKLTDNQIKALVDLQHGNWSYGISIRGRHALPSLRKRGFVYQMGGSGKGADQWQISPAGLEAMKRCATTAHLTR
jgi:hypothetical protein